MRVLVVHNKYASAMPSGENSVVQRQLEVLADDVDLVVESLLVSSDSVADLSILGRARLPLAPIIGGEPLATFEQCMASFRPDIVHFHNPYPFFSPRLVEVAHDAGFPIVQTIHNYRHRCMNGLLFRDGAVCTACEDSRWRHLPGVVRGCYRGSRLQSVPMAIALNAHRSAVHRLDLVIAVSEFVADRVASWGVAPDRVVVVPSPVDAAPRFEARDAAGLLFAGRMSAEKGILELIDAWQAAALSPPHRLLIAGSGPLEAEVRRRVDGLSSIDLLGFLNTGELALARARTRAAVSCSRAFETATSAAESFAVGRPVLAVDVGAQGRVVPDSAGWVVAPDHESLVDGIRRACLEPPGDYEDRCQAAHDLHRARFSNEVHRSALKAAYSAAIVNHGTKP